MSDFDDDQGPRSKNGQFKKGYCPNPKGRPRKLRGDAAIRDAFNTPVPMTWAGRRTYVPLIVAYILKLGTDGMAGDRVSKREFSRLAIEFGIADPTVSAKDAEPRQITITPVRWIRSGESGEEAADRAAPP
ncbi:hypothetical protein BH09PSE2_BH09PSE2_05090 [soil metagenome]